MSIRRPRSTSLNQGPQTLSYSPTKNAVLICSDVDGGSYELYIVPKDSINRGEIVQDAKKAQEDQLSLWLVINLLFLTKPLINTSSLQTPFVKYIVWSNDMETMALLSKHAIVIASKKLDHRCTLHETIHVKGGAWDDNGVFIFTNLNHIKYCLPNGDNGIIKTLDVPIYITKVLGNIIFFLDRNGKSRVIVIDATEYIFKLSLLKKKYDHVMSMIRNSQLCGQDMIAYLREKGFPEVALHFVKDERTRFDLALNSGNIQIAIAVAKKIDEKDHWYKLGVEALRQGNSGIMEYAYQRTKNFERLSFLYLITGNTNKLGKMLKIAEVKNDVMGQFHNALYLGIIQERVTILENSGHLQLAYVTASTHGLHDIADRIAEKLGGNLLILPKGKVPSLLMSPVPITRGGDWPLLRVMKGIFEGGLENKGVIDEDEGGDKADWGEEMDLDNVNGFKNQDTQEIQEEYEAESSLRVLGRMVLFGLKEKNEFISDEDYYESDRKETEVTCRHLDHVNMLGLSKTTFRLHFLIKIELMRHYNVSATFDVSDLSPYSGESEDEENSRTSFSQAGEDDAGALDPNDASMTVEERVEIEVFEWRHLLHVEDRDRDGELVALGESGGDALCDRGGEGGKRVLCLQV
ncbi:coatomer subunit alpha-1 [Tanacetum coccineum]|uniref:Coatomer subunit alpha-1 n=1 Tax=Tanacetum coccineum TaxID=301880 RepID=A0ABQ5I289_9ASTR